MPPLEMGVNILLGKMDKGKSIDAIDLFLFLLHIHMILAE